MFSNINTQIATQELKEEIKDKDEVFEEDKDFNFDQFLKDGNLNLDELI